MQRLKGFLARRVVRRLLLGAVVGAAVVVALLVSVLFLEDPVSRALRGRTQVFLNAQSERLFRKGQSGALTFLDRGLLHGATLAGIAWGRVSYPEASAILSHYVYGDGSALELPSGYFRASPYLKATIAELGPGRHGPIGFEQSRDWRLSLALNPYYLDVQGDAVRLWHPRIELAAITGEPTVTVIPIGKLRIRVYDNLISALGPSPFAVSSEWRIS